MSNRASFGRLHRKRSSAQRALNLCEHNGWIDAEIEPVTLAGETFYKVTGVPVFKRAQQMHGTLAGASNPIPQNAKHRHAGRHR